eukprot:TRINITY_DN11449_c0_g1_i5.p1 TRINITY_DN11449_c0_g1~~TRINITY_DN11449_c0_g1_i5.p1  ORF type:complete len:325 (+),score=53.87 TRINITY_DN11449_c0_g1_i5:94-1068(+)
MLSLVAGIAAAILGYTSLVFYAAYNTTLQQAVIFLNWVNIPPLPLKASRYNDKTIQVQDVQINDENGVTYHGWHYMATSPSRPSVLWLSGNGSNRAHPRRRQFYTRLHRLLDVNVIVFDYSGYGDSEGRPSEQQTMRDARLFWDYACRQAGNAPCHLIAHSLGTGIAAGMLLSCVDDNVRQPDTVTLLTPFTKIIDVMTSHVLIQPLRLWPAAVAWLQGHIVDTFDSSNKWKQLARRGVEYPVLIVHGTNDWVVPHRLGLKLFDVQQDAGLKSSMLLVSKATHNNLALYPEVFSTLAGRFGVDFERSKENRWIRTRVWLDRVLC